LICCKIGLMRRLRGSIYNILRWSEKYAKTDMVYLTKGGFWTTLNTIISSFSSFVLTLFFANFLAPETYGIYKYIFSVYGLLSAFSLSGIDILVIESISKGKSNVLNQAFNYSLRWNIPFCLISFATSIYYYLASNFELATAFSFIAILAPLISSFGLFGSYLNGKKNFKLLSIANSVNNLITSAIVLIATIYTQNPVIIVFSYFISQTIINGFFYLYTSKKSREGSPDMAEIDLSKGKHFSVMNIFTVISQHLDKIVIFHLLGGSSLALYSFALAPVNQIQGLLKSSGPLYSPKILAKTKEENKRELPKKFIQILGLMIIPVLIYVILVPYFYRFFFPQYVDATIYSQFYALILLLFGKKFIGIPTVIHLPKKTLYKISIINALVVLTPKLSLIYFFGLPGAIAGEILANILLTLVSFYYFKRM